MKITTQHQLMMSIGQSRVMWRYKWRHQHQQQHQIHLYILTDPHLFSTWFWHLNVCLHYSLFSVWPAGSIISANKVVSLVICKFTRLIHQNSTKSKTKLQMPYGLWEMTFKLQHFPRLIQLIFSQTLANHWVVHFCNISLLCGQMISMYRHSNNKEGDNQVGRLSNL